MPTKTIAKNGATKTDVPVATEATAPPIQLERLGTERIIIPIRGVTPLICHRFDEKARRMMLDNMQGRKTHKEIRDPNADFGRSLYVMKDGYGFPILGFKKATVGAARFFGKSVTMTALRQCLWFFGELSSDERDLLVRIEGDKPVMREDYVRINNGRGTDLRYRGEFGTWHARLEVAYVTTMISRDSVIALVDAGGMGVGVGELRPERGGQNGTYEVDDKKKIEIVR